MKLLVLTLLTIPCALRANPETQSQQVISAQACAPTAAFNALQLLGGKDAEALKPLGVDSTERLRKFFDTYYLKRKTSDPSRKDSSRYDESVGGVFAEDSVGSLNEFFLESGSKTHLSLLDTTGPTGESPQNRVVSALKTALKNRGPVLLFLQIQGVLTIGEKSEWTGLGGHAVTLMSVSNVDPSLNGVELIIHDPFDNKIKKAFLFFSLHHQFIGMDWNYNSYTWTQKSYLRIEMPEFATDFRWDKRIVIYLKKALGDFREH